MLRKLALILVVAACGSSMEMEETVERMVMVRTTGSDLQPAATGYIYKKKNDGKESVIEMGESEVMEHLSKLYEQPPAFAAPIPITKGRSLAKDEDDTESETHSEERIIPVKEKQEDRVDGIVDEDYKKIFDDHLKKYGNNNAYDDYVRSLKNFGGGLYDGFKGDYIHDDGGYAEYKKRHNYGNGNAGDYHNANYKSYAFSDKSLKEGHAGAKDYKKLYRHDDHNEGYGQKSEEKDDVLGTHKVFDKDDKQEKDHKIFDDDDKFGFSKFTDGHEYHEDDGGYENDDSYESGHHADFGEKYHHNNGSGENDENHSAEEKDTSSQHHDDYGHKSRQPAGHSFGFEIKH